MSTPVVVSLPPRCSTYAWNHAGLRLTIVVREQAGKGPAWLLLPALCTISRRLEWQPLFAAIGTRKSAEAPRLIRVDWPGSHRTWRTIR